MIGTRYNLQFLTIARRSRQSLPICRTIAFRPHRQFFVLPIIWYIRLVQCTCTSCAPDSRTYWHPVFTSPSRMITSVRSSQKGISLPPSHFWFFFRKAKPRITFDINRLFFWAFAKMNSDLIFETVTIREWNLREKTKMSVLIFDFCHYKGVPKNGI